MRSQRSQSTFSTVLIDGVSLIGVTATFQQ